MSEDKKTAEILTPFGEFKTPGINQNTIETLELVLARAKAGEVTAVAIAFITPGNHAACEIAFGAVGYAMMLGASVAMTDTIMRKWREE